MRRIVRFILYLFGMMVLAAGITLNTKTAMGVSPLISIGYAVSQVTGFSFGNMTFLVYVAFVAIQFGLRRHNAKLVDLLQLVVSWLFGLVLDWFNAILPAATTLPGRLAELVLAVILTGIGAAMTLTMELVPNPGDGLVNAVAETFGLKTGLAKNICDASGVVLTVVFSLIAAHRVIGIGLGTLVTVLGTGRVMAVYYRFLMNPGRRLAGLPPREQVVRQAQKK